MGQAGLIVPTHCLSFMQSVSMKGELACGVHHLDDERENRKREGAETEKRQRTERSDSEMDTEGGREASTYTECLGVRKDI